MTKEQVDHTITTLPQLVDDTLIHYLKCASSKQTAAEKKLLKPLIAAIEKERRSRSKDTHGEHN